MSRRARGSGTPAVPGADDRTVPVDRLTGLPTRDALRGTDGPDWVRSEPVVAVAIIDVDGFGALVDNYGVVAGDRVLVDVAARLEEAVGKETAWLLRTGDDEFCLVVPGRGSANEVKSRIARWVTAVFERPFKLDGSMQPLAAVTGIAIGSPSELFELMRQAGLTGRALPGGGIALHRARPSTAIAVEELEDELRLALEGGELAAYFQPVISLQEEHVVSVEALARWRHPVHGLLPAGEWVPAIEMGPAIHELDRFMLQAACSGFKTFLDEGCNTTSTVAVNVSAEQLDSPAFPQEVAETLAHTGLAPEQLVIELTETALIKDPSAASVVANELRDIGVGLFVDDFGVGYSSLAYLRRFPVTGVKIDRSFIAELGSSGQDAAIVASVISLAHDMSLTTVAEGVETMEQVTALRALGCERAQGFLWGEAMSVTDACEAVQHLDARRWQRRVKDRAPEPLSASGRQIRDMHDRGSSASTIAAALNAAGMRTPEDRRWTTWSVLRVIRTLHE
jgi:diguanylate cyclase (GGDEF)-like protein